MTEESSTISHLSVTMATTGMTDGHTTASLSSSSSSRGNEFYFRIVLVVVGVVGTATNGLILYALVASKQHQKHVLIVNQNALDLFTSLMIILVHSLKLFNIPLTGSGGYWLCRLLLTEVLVWTGTDGAVVNLAAIAVDRYLKIVHHTWSMTHLKNWMVYSAMAFSWIGTFTWNMAAVFSTTAIIDGACIPYVIWANNTAKIFLSLWIFVSFYVIILLIFIFCYWRILVVIRRQAKVMAGHAAAGPSTAQAQIHKMQSNVVKTMILVCAFYAVSWMPNHVYILNVELNPNPPPYFSGGHYATLFIALLYMCTNPFIYAINFNPVREVLLRLIPCRRIPVEPQNMT